MGFKIPRFTPSLNTGVYRQGVRVLREQPRTPRPGHELSQFGMGWEGGGRHGGPRPERLEVRKAEREWEAGNDDAFNEVRDINERAEAGSTKPSVSQLRKHLARKGTQFKPTGSVSNSPYDLAGGDLGVPSYGVSQMGRQPLKKVVAEARRRARSGGGTNLKGGKR